MCSAPQRGTTQNFWVLLFCHDRLDSIWGAEPIQNGFRPSEGHNPEFGNIYAFFWQNVAIYALFRKISPFMQFFGKMSRFTHFFLGSAQTVKITLSSAFKFLSALVVPLAMFANRIKIWSSGDITSKVRRLSTRLIHLHCHIALECPIGIIS